MDDGGTIDYSYPTPTGHKLLLSVMEKTPEAVAPVASELLTVVTKMMVLAFRRDSDSVEFFFRNCKYPTNTVMELVGPKFADNLSIQVMRASKLYETISHAWFVFLNDG